MMSEYLLEIRWNRYRNLNYPNEEDKQELKKLTKEMERLKIGIFGK